MHAIFISGDHLERGNRTGRLVNNRKGREDSYHLRESTLVLTESFAKTSGNKVIFLFSNLSSKETIVTIGFDFDINSQLYFAIDRLKMDPNFTLVNVAKTSGNNIFVF